MTPLRSDTFSFPPDDPAPAPPLRVAGWLNTPHPLTLAGLRGRVVAMHAFQMLCPGCVAHGLPQATRLHEAFPAHELAVVGLHSVFEHHAVMQPRAALEAFVHEYRLRFPIAMDAPDPHGDPIPQTMRALALRGTPSLILLDRRGRIRLHHFGHVDDLRLGALIGRLIEEPADAATDHGLDEPRDRATATVATEPGALCDEQGCAIR